MKINKVMTFCICLLIGNACWGQYYSNQNYPFYKYSWAYASNSSSIIYKDGYSIDTLVPKLGITQKIKVKSKVKNGEQKLNSHKRGASLFE